MKALLIAIQKRLEECAELKYIDKDWSQLQYENPPVKFPCALIDLDNISFSQLGDGSQWAETQIGITVANIRLNNSSLKAPDKERAYEAIDTIEKIHQLLHRWSNGNFQPLQRTNLQKMLSDHGREVYKVFYVTAFKPQLNNDSIPVNVGLVIKSEPEIRKFPFL